MSHSSRHAECDSFANREDMGVVAIDENGAWRLKALGEVAMAWFNGRYRAEPVLCL